MQYHNLSVLPNTLNWLSKCLGTQANIYSEQSLDILQVLNLNLDLFEWKPQDVLNVCTEDVYQSELLQFFIACFLFNLSQLLNMENLTFQVYLTWKIGTWQPLNVSSLLYVLSHFGLKCSELFCGFSILEECLVHFVSS